MMQRQADGCWRGVHEHLSPMPEEQIVPRDTIA